ncbi:MULTISPECIES: LysR family transcriptional regulator [unclassified Bradyrhizobium]|uniref:LysR family transcriptional regulator n=1 Tax=unclassified Bradyrhizobium TaxID=2631580 RepID=UPI001FF81125|nr:MULTISPECIES: LysR family transcriptional regulator [unclassified Bradyrhizobium]MCK1612605.1 LysR family transcriptional regulator [Bradyrhizobium sp. 163]MCK1766376.1 LysR family transcriptional regulator [Bradyrhizobium sp. 136]
MSKVRRPISLNALNTFECAARLLSFSAAAEELNLTRSAVSHQITKLEEIFGFRLFDRRSDGVVLTSAGAGYYNKIRGALSEIGEVTSDVLGRPRRQRLTVHSAPTFSSRWLLSKITRFTAAFPDIDLRIIAASGPPDFRDPGLDVAICYGAQGLPNCSEQLFLTEGVYPMCNPTLKESAGLHSPTALARTTLIRTDQNLVSWDFWFRGQGLELPGDAKQVQLKPSYLAIEAAIQAIGVVLESDVLTAEELATGKLVVPFPSSPVTMPAYYLVTPDDDRSQRSLPFRKWLLDEAQRVNKQNYVGPCEIS